MNRVTAATPNVNWETSLAALLERLSAAQQELLAMLSTKRELIVRRDHAGLAELAPREAELAAELQACHDERQQLLDQADAEGLPNNSLSDLSAALSPTASSRLREPVAEARRQSQLIRHECLAQWVAVQRTVLHLSQMLEIIATGGRSQPTYGRGAASQSSGALMDQAV
jgi:hypothetical protein